MIKLTVDEAYAFDYYSILELKFKNSFISEDILNITKNDLINDLGEILVNEILNSNEYKNLLESNQITFNAVDKAKEDLVAASYVDKCNYNRMLSKKALQNKFFTTKLSETKIGYEKLK
jgi:hypothetical protein